MCAALCVAALGRDHVIGVLMPNGSQRDIPDSYQLVSHLGMRSVIVNIEGAVTAIRQQLTESEITPTSQTTINLPPRIRMAALYAVSQSMNGRVINTCNLSEDWVGYSTRYGDSAGDGDAAAEAEEAVEEALDLTDFQNALNALSASSFTSEQPTEKEEIRLTLYLENENFPEVEIILYRYDGTNCLAVVDGVSVSLIPRSSVMDLVEAVQAIVLN